MKIIGYLSKKKRVALDIYDPMKFLEPFKKHFLKRKYVICEYEVRMDTESGEYEIELRIVSKTKGHVYR